jgi:peptide/nickel transport system permease protein
LARFLIRRIIRGVLVMFVVTIVVFAIFFIGPGPSNVAHVLAGRQATPQTIAQVSHRLLLDRPLIIQYGHFLNGLVHGNLGYSYYHGQPVTSVLKAAFPVTLSLAIGASILWLVIGVLSGVLSAVRTRSVGDRVVTVVALIFYSMPPFVLGLLLLYFVYYRLTVAGIHIFPGSGYTYFSANPLKWLEGLVLPWLTLALISAAAYTRLTRGSMLDVLGEDYIRTARSKGLSERRVVFRHGLRAALTPVVSQFGIDLGVLIGGAVVTETVFSMPGLGYTAIQSIQQQDLPIIIGVVIIASAAVVVANIVVDALYALVDPRVRLH